MNFETVFFDLDATLYSASNGLWPAIRDRIELYMHERLELSDEEIATIRKSYYLRYGTTLKGLEANFGVDPSDYLDFVHDLPLDDYLADEPRLGEMLSSIPTRRWVFTNSDINHARRVLAKLELSDCFEGIVDIWAMAPYCKPHPEAYQVALEMAQAPDPQACVLLDDSVPNLAGARQAGFFTVLVGEDGHDENVDRAIEQLSDLPQALPELWEQG
jgi:pyrimidine 5'-nucleotidase